MEPSAASFGLQLDEITKSLGENSEFWNQFAGSGVANILLVVAVGVFAGLKKLCTRKSKCRSHLHCCCLDIDVRDPTMRNQPGSSAEGSPSLV